MSVRALQRDFGRTTFCLIAVVAVAFVALAVWNVRESVAWYMTLAKSHAWSSWLFSRTSSCERAVEHRFMIATTLWIRGFALTLAVEEAVAVPLLAAVEPSTSRRVLAVLLVNLATHPLVWFFFPHLGWTRTWVVVTAEAWAFAFEILAYRVVFARAPWARCAVVSIAANLASFLLGIVAADWGFFR